VKTFFLPISAGSHPFLFFSFTLFIHGLCGVCMCDVNNVGTLASFEFCYQTKTFVEMAKSSTSDTLKNFSAQLSPTRNRQNAMKARVKARRQNARSNPIHVSNDFYFVTHILFHCIQNGPTHFHQKTENTQGTAQES